ncbi:glycosyltransferase family 2 protein [Ureibacillus massiliensis]|uniref:glycosyltransferase family 2 protein n=1 Tax=Ureibacillus massiliensis TaxID=292806 RepID=UPI00068BC54D|nr:glycosyltransferase [Ureibacillus massiliensis]
MTTVSIVLPTYNRAGKLKKAVETCLNQTYKDIELIIVDDGSTDETKKVIENFNDSRIKYFYKHNEGLPIALNFGFEKSKGKYLTWTSDDNEYLENAIEVMVNELDKHKEPIFVYSNIYLKNENTGKINLLNLGGTNRMYMTNYVYACFMYHRDIYLELGGYSLDKRLVEDFDYWIKIYEKYKMIHIPQALYIYLQHDDSLTNTKKVEINKVLDKVYEEHHCFDKIYNDINKYSGSRDIYIWGTGTLGSRVYNELALKRKLKIKGMIDNNIKRSNQKFENNINIFHSSEISNFNTKPYIIIASTFRAEIEMDLHYMGFKVDVDYY